MRPSSPTAATSLPTVLAPLRPAFGYALAFSIFVNLMLLGPMLYMLQVFDRVLASRSSSTLAMLSVGVAIALVAMGLVDSARSQVLVRIGRRVDEAFARPVLRHLMRNASAPSVRAPGTGLRDVATLRTFLSGPSIVALFDAPWMVVWVAVIYLFHPAMGALALVGAFTLALVSWLSERMNRAPLEQLAGASRQGARFIDEGLRNADVVNAMGMASALSARWEAHNRRALDLMEQSGTRGGTLLAASKFLRQALQVAMMGLGAWLVLHNAATPGIMVAATILFGRAMAPVEAILGNWATLASARSAWGRLAKVMPEALHTPERTPLPQPQGRLTAEGLVLTGARPDAPIVRGVSLDLPAGESLGLLGPSGAGKSSLAKLLLGVWQPTAGRMRIDGAELSQWDPESLGRHFGYLPQDVELLPGSVAENIARFGTEERDAVVEAARRAHALEMILALPDGFDTVLGEGGVRLSAGQAQRVGLARALHGSPRVLVLDEPNSNLDTEGEDALRAVLADLRRDKVTLVMITHKPSLVGTLDHLMLMRAGRVELYGPRDQVMARLMSPKLRAA